MRSQLVIALFLISSAATAAAQLGPEDPRFMIPKLKVSLGFNHVDANAPPGICNCFGVNGGFATVEFRVRPWLGLVGNFTGGHGNDISDLHQNLTLLSYTGGARINLPRRRLVPYAQILVGGAHGSDSYFPTGNTYTTSANSFALNPGAGLDVNLTRRFAIRAVQASYLRTTFPNGVDNVQNQLTLSTGIVMKFGVWTPPLPPPPATPPPASRDFTLSCSVADATVQAGSPVQVTATSSDPNVAFSWRSSGGTVHGSGASIAVDTTGLAEGVYYINGTAMLASDASVTESCSTAFRIELPPPPPAAPLATAPPIVINSVTAAPQVSEADRERDFREHVKDIYFDLNKSNLRPDALRTADADAAYLAAHPRMDIQIGGFADQRGSSKYNLALGERRAHSVLDRLVQQGVAADRVKIVTFGHDAQSCTASSESCYQQNRRVGFLLQP